MFNGFACKFSQNFSSLLYVPTCCRNSATASEGVRTKIKSRGYTNAAKSFNCIERFAIITDERIRRKLSLNLFPARRSNFSTKKATAVAPPCPNPLYSICSQLNR